MNREDIIRMAREADIKFKTDVFRSDFCDGVYEDDFERFAALVASAEREACAKVCEKLQKDMTPIASLSAFACSIMIKARGQG